MTPERIAEIFAEETGDDIDASDSALRDFARRMWNEALEEAAKASLDIYGGRAHSYSSENADIYRAQDHALTSCAKAIRALKLPEEP